MPKGWWSRQFLPLLEAVGPDGSAKPGKSTNWGARAPELGQLPSTSLGRCKNIFSDWLHVVMTAKAKKLGCVHLQIFGLRRTSEPRVQRQLQEDWEFETRLRGGEQNRVGPGSPALSLVTTKPQSLHLECEQLRPPRPAQRGRGVDAPCAASRRSAAALPRWGRVPPLVHQEQSVSEKTITRQPNAANPLLQACRGATIGMLP